MGAAAVTARLRPRRQADPGPAGLAFDRPGGPLVAVCGLVPGAGASTLAYALAARAARESSAPVLLCEADPAAGALAWLTGVATTHSFGELALGVSAGHAPDAPFALAADGMRLIAASPRRGAPAGAAALPLLRDARAAHGLTVVDCGALAQPEALPALELATHVLWVLPATAPGVGRARGALEHLAPRPNGACETIVAVATTPRRSVSVRELRELAEPRAERLVLVPHAPALLLAGGPSPPDALAAMLADLAGVLRRPGR